MAVSRNWGSPRLEARETLLVGLVMGPIGLVLASNEG